MEKRTERIKFWLTDKELKQIDRKAGKLGIRTQSIRIFIILYVQIIRWIIAVSVPVGIMSGQTPLNRL